jgi:hypothetical protein
MSHRDELIIPAAAKKDEKSFEIVRVWVAGNAQHVSLLTRVWDDPGAWGIMLADLARHIVNSYEEEGASNRTSILQRIKAAFDAETQSPTDVPFGKLVPGGKKDEGGEDP